MADLDTIAFLGIAVQLGGATLLVVLFVLLRRYVIRRAYFTAWTSAWAAIMVAIAALLARFTAGTGALAETDPAVVALYVLYQAAKLTALVFLLSGTRTYVRGSARVVGRGQWAGVAAVSVGTALLMPGGLAGLMLAQSVLAVPALAWCAHALLTLPPSRRSLGGVATGTSFALIAAVWAWYGAAFGSAIFGGPLAGGVVYLPVNYSAYFDVLLNVCLGYGMVVLLMEDAKREVDDAQAELRLAHDRLRRDAAYDALTGALNRLAFSEGVGLDMARATFGTVVVADVDDLKAVNDRWGHPTGDRLLRHIAETLRAALRPYDKLYRWGGDEFLIVMPSARSADVQVRLEDAIATAPPLPVDDAGEAVRLAVSLGAADYASAEELTVAIEAADQLMYARKAERKNVPRHSPAYPGAAGRLIRR